MEKYSPDNKLTIMTRSQVRSFDAFAINTLGIPGTVLMENAGRSCAELIMEKLASIDNPEVSIFCGTGNNGGDGYVIARHLLNKGIKTHVIIAGDRDKIKGDAKTNLDILEKMGQHIQTLDLASSNISAKVESCCQANLIVDALLGTGLKGMLRDDYQILINSINSLKIPVIAVDIPSGLDCDTGCPLGASIKAQATVTFVAVKKGFATSPEAEKFTGEIFVASIGAEPDQYGQP
jgi:NAD(P)H-hydrate epimerase